MKKIFAMLALAALSSAAQAGGDAAKGAAVYKKLQCAACHGENGNPADPKSIYPKLAGQHEDYLANSLRQYQRAANEATPKTATMRKNAIMQGFATQLSSQDVADVAAYLAGLKGELSTRQ